MLFRSAYCALMFIDLDNFKPLNDQYGHVVGDLLLIDAAKRLTSCVREADTVARFGGDEFVILLGEIKQNEKLSKEHAMNIAEKIRAKLAEVYRLQLRHDHPAVIEHHCSGSIGIALFGPAETSMDEILKQADAAMYRSKEGGRNRICFYDNASCPPI